MENPFELALQPIYSSAFEKTSLRLWVLLAKIQILYYCLLSFKQGN